MLNSILSDIKSQSMHLVSNILIGLVALLHLYFCWFEMFAWKTKGRALFKKYDNDFFEKTKVLAANQGLYNAVLAAGLIWSLIIKTQPWNVYVAIFFLGCVLIAGLYGGATASKKIYYVQAIPALLGLIAIHLL